MTELVMRPPEQVMTLSRLGSLHQCRLSFMRQLLRRLLQLLDQGAIALPTLQSATATARLKVAAADRLVLIGARTG